MAEWHVGQYKYMTDDLRPNYSCDNLADGYKVPRDRALVWHVFSDLFLDCSWSDDELSWMAKSLRVRSLRFKSSAISFPKK